MGVILDNLQQMLPLLQLFSRYGGYSGYSYLIHETTVVSPLWGYSEKLVGKALTKLFSHYGGYS